MTIKETPNKITAVLKVTATAEFFDDEASEETVRYAIEQDLEDAGFDVDVTMLKKQPQIVRCKDCKHYRINTVYPGTNMIMKYCAKTGIAESNPDWFCADGERNDGKEVKI